jgi:hypothetical protein
VDAEPVTTETEREAMTPATGRSVMSRGSDPRRVVVADSCHDLRCRA